MIENTAVKYLEFLIHEYMNRLTTLSTQKDLSDVEIEILYAWGYYLFTCGKYNTAKNIFTRLTAYTPYTAYLWRALGAANQQMKNYADAIAAYDMAIANDETDIVSYVYRAESKILSGSPGASLADLEKAVKIGVKDQQSEAWVKRAKLLLRVHKRQ